MMHFVVIQFLALLYALVARGMYFDLSDSALSPGPNLIAAIAWVARPIWFLGYLLFIYALFTALAAAFAVFRLSGWYNEYMLANHAPVTEDELKAAREARDASAVRGPNGTPEDTH